MRKNLKNPHSGPQLRQQAHGGALKSGGDTVGLPVFFDSMKQCEAVLNIPPGMLQDWKNEGAPGFKNHRIYSAQLLPWVFSKIFAPVNTDRATGEPPVITWADALDKQKWQERAHILVEFAACMTIIREALLPLRQFLLAMAPQLGHRCNPTDPVFAQKAIEAHIKQGLRMIADAERDKVSTKGNE